MSHYHNTFCKVRQLHHCCILLFLIALIIALVLLASKANAQIPTTDAPTHSTPARSAPAVTPGPVQGPVQEIQSPAQEVQNTEVMEMPKKAISLEERIAQLKAEEEATKKRTAIITTVVIAGFALLLIIIIFKLNKIIQVNKGQKNNV